MKRVTSGSTNNSPMNRCPRARISCGLAWIGCALAFSLAVAQERGRSDWPLSRRVTGGAIAAWRALEADLARGLLDEATSRAGLRLTAAEEQERLDLNAALDRLQPQVLRLVTQSNPTRWQSDPGRFARTPQHTAPMLLDTACPGPMGNVHPGDERPHVGRIRLAVQRPDDRPRSDRTVGGL